MLSSYRRIGLILLSMVLLLLAIPTQTWANPLDGQLLAAVVNCTSCQGTGRIRGRDISYPNSEREYCRICGGKYYPHDHMLCGSCGGKGYRVVQEGPASSGGDYFPSGGSYSPSSSSGDLPEAPEQARVKCEKCNGTSFVKRPHFDLNIPYVQRYCYVCRKTDYPHQHWPCDQCYCSGYCTAEENAIGREKDAIARSYKTTSVKCPKCGGSATRSSSERANHYTTYCLHCPGFWSGKIHDK